MVDRIKKTLRQLQLKQQVQLLGAMRQIRAGHLIGLDVKKLHGQDGLYRVRKGTFRIIFRKTPSGENVILSVDRRSDTTYNEL